VGKYNPYGGMKSEKGEVRKKEKLLERPFQMLGAVNE